MHDSDARDRGVAPEGHMPASNFFRTNRGVATILFAIMLSLAAYIWFSDWAFRELRDGFLLGGFPLFAVLLMAVSALILLIDGQSHAVETGLAAISLAAGLVIFAAVAAIAVTFISFDHLGFVPAVTVFITAVSALLGYRPVWSAALVGVLIALGLRAIMYALNVEVGDGFMSPVFTLLVE